MLHSVQIFQLISLQYAGIVIELASLRLIVQYFRVAVAVCVVCLAVCEYMSIG